MIEKLKKLKINIGWKSLVLIGVCVVLVLIDLLTKIFEEKYNWNFTVIPNFIEVAAAETPVVRSVFSPIRVGDNPSSLQ